MPTVSMRKCTSYDKAGQAVIAAVKDLGGMERFISPGDSVLIKPNMLGAYNPDRHVTTHPSVVKAVAEMVLDCRGKPIIGDSPGLDPFPLVSRKTGIGEVGKALGVPVLPLIDSIPIRTKKGGKFRKIELSRLAVESDKIINIPKMKTHCQMTLTLGVKNLFGTVVAQRKAEWHYKVGLNRDVFASLLIEIWDHLRPCLTVMDGVWGMEGRGPSNGVGRLFGVISTSDDSLAMDQVLSPLMGVKEGDFPLLRAARSYGMAYNEIRTIGDSVESFSPKVDLPKSDSLRLLPPWMDRIGRDILSSRPEQDRERCVGCQKCVQVCRAGALTMKEGKVLSFDYGRCIRCYCCHEMCPVDAIKLHRGAILRVLDLLDRI
ncbi:Uncharacterized conserved protein, DUF362 family [Dethiosulfovibrio salsuginis]|uniref:Uncharacterized conserved protein, DUF362 family n=2 Tax=Dethiosulfovibrio salsuginis TaxID=561720 RepID=A0A1X7LBZ6_9BACT|nr:Uncharacterized conserved protein, DUF362 family [Dethiosulfovibrio salsuginis]